MYVCLGSILLNQHSADLMVQKRVGTEKAEGGKQIHMKIELRLFCIYPMRFRLFSLVIHSRTACLPIHSCRRWWLVGESTIQRQGACPRLAGQHLQRHIWWSGMQRF